MAETTFDISTTEPVLVMTRTFDAPREVVFQAHIDPAAIAQWWGPRGVTTVVDEMEVRPGGGWRYVHVGDDGEHAFRGEYREVQAPERLVWTFEYEGMPGQIAVETMTFEDAGGKTLLTVRSEFGSLDELRGMAESGMEQGARETWDRLDEYLAGRKATA